MIASENRLFVYLRIGKVLGILANIDGKNAQHSACYNEKDGRVEFTRASDRLLWVHVPESEFGDNTKDAEQIASEINTAWGAI
jgi:uncharacterized SAM-dependent methyltransferase